MHVLVFECIVKEGRKEGRNVLRAWPLHMCAGSVFVSYEVIMYLCVCVCCGNILFAILIDTAKMVHAPCL